jgi:hypothetical protein
MTFSSVTVVTNANCLRFFQTKWMLAVCFLAREIS